jgi:hypothetical protein
MNKLMLAYIQNARMYIVNIDGKTIHTKPTASESCNTDDAKNKATVSGADIKTGEYSGFNLCEYCF